MSVRFNPKHGPIVIEAEVTGPARSLTLELILDTGATNSLLSEAVVLALKDVERSIEAAVQSGHFASADDAVATAWPSFQQRKQKQAQPAKKPLTPDELNQQLLADGLITQLPNPAEDIDDDDVPIAIKGEPLSETIIRERR